MRLFAAIDLPDAIKDTLSPLQSGLDGVKWVSEAQMHLTLRFIGEVDTLKFEALRDALSQVPFAPFEMMLQGVGKFPAKGAPRVLWVGVNAPPALEALAAAVERAVVTCGLPPADKPFSPHITLGRVKSSPLHSATERYFEKHAAYRSAPFVVNHFVMYSSDLRPSGPVYTAEGVFKGRGEDD